MLRRTLAALLLAASFAQPAAAQEAGTVDFSIFARYSMLADNISAEPAMGPGVRLGMFLFRDIAIEFDQSWTKGDTPAFNYAPLNVRLAAHMPIGTGWTFIVGAGWVRDQTNEPGPGPSVDHDGVSGLVGLSRRITDRVLLRFDFIGESLASTTIGPLGNGDNSINTHAQLGIVWRFGVAKPVMDSDGDGVPNGQDQCANTPAGSIVNGIGCVPVLDTDNDGVWDNADRCANTPAGIAVTAEGCARDTDSDGVLDAADRCANTPVGTRVDTEGCAVPLDADGDRVIDSLDRCPNTPAGTLVDAAGCALPQDDDGDKVPNTRDICANTPPGTRVDSRGCPLIFTEEGPRNIVLEGVTFATGSAILTDGAKVVLDRVAEQLADVPEVNIEVQGHTDNTGSAATNTRLSAARAESVRAYFAAKGVAASRMVSRGYGPSQPKVPNSNSTNRQVNRRVELVRTN